MSSRQYQETITNNIAAAGNSASTATRLVYGSDAYIVTTATNLQGVMLPPAPTGTYISIYAAVANIDIYVYPQPSGTVNWGAGGGFLMSELSATPFLCIDGLNWLPVSITL